MSLREVLYWTAAFFGFVFASSLALQVALNVLISRCHARFLTDVPIDATTNATIRVHPIRIKLWGLLLKFIQEPSQENVASLVLPFVEITITKQQHVSSCVASAMPLDLASIAALASPTNPIWSQALPLIHRFGFVCRFVHLVDIFMTNISILVRDTNHQPMFSVTNASVNATMLLDPDKHRVIVSLNVCHHLPMTISIPSAHMNVDVQQVALQVTIPISKSPSDARLPLPSSVSISGHSLYVSVKLLSPQPPLDATIPSAPVSHPTVSQTHTTAANNNNNEAMINLIALLPSVVSFSWHSAKVTLEHPSSLSQCSVELLQIVLVSQNGSPKHAAVAVDVHRLSAQVVPRQASPPLQLLQLGPMTGSVDVTRPHVSSLALNVWAELKRVHVVLSDVLEPWVSLATNLQIALPPAPHVSILSSVQLHGTVTNVSVLLCPRTALDLDDPSHLCPPLEILVDDVYVSALPPHLVGVRSRAELRLSRVGVRLESSPAPSVTMDYMRMLFYPIASFLHGKTDVAADVEMEGEWLDVHYTPQLLHALGGVARLVLFTCQTPLSQVFATPKPAADDNVIRPRRSGVDMFKREPVYPRVKFHGLVKHIVASFPVALPSTPPSTEQVSVDSLMIETDATTSSRFRMHMDQIHVSTQGPKKCKPYMVVGHFAVEEAPVGGTSVVDLYGQDVAVTWDVLTQVRVAKAVQDVTTAVYRLLFQIFHGYTMHVAPPHSKFKVWGVRVGVNPAMDDAAAYIAMRAHLSNAISASGDKLHRVAVRNVSVSVPALEITVTVDEFGGDDVPDLWTFGSIQVTWRHQPKLVSMAHVSVRRTVAGRLDYVFGDFEAMLRQRQKVLAASDDGHGASSVDDETLCVCICDLHVEIPYASWSDLVTLSTQMQTLAATLATIWHDTMSEFWRPQHPLFFRYFIKLPRLSSRPKIELDMRQLDVEWVDDPMETWLAHMAPLWMDTLAEQEGRRQVVLHDHWTSHLHDNTTMTNEAAGFESKHIELLEMFAKAYVTRAQEMRKHQQQPYTHNKTNNNMARLRVSVCRLHGWVLPLVDPVRLIRKMKELDNDTLSLLQLPRCVRPCFDLLVGVSMHVHAESVHVHVRGGGSSQASPPIVKVPNLELQGDVVVAQPTSTSAFHVTHPVDIAAFSHLQVVTSRIPLKCFLDLNIGVTGTTVAYSPVLNSSMVGLALDAQQCLFAYILPSLEVDTWAYWDIVRRLVHGKYSVTCRDTTVQLMACQNVAEGVQLTLHNVQVAYTNKGTVDIHVDKVQCKLEPHGGAVDTFVDIPAVALAVDWTWMIDQDDDDTVSSLHYIYPMKFTYLENPNQVQAHVHNPHIMHHSPSRLSMGVRCIVGTNDRKDTTSVVVYGSTMARLLELGQSYMEMCAIPTVTSRQRRYPRRPLVPRLSDLQHHIHRVVLRSLQVEHGVDVALYHSDQSPVGVRVHINDIFASLAMTCGAIRSLADCFQHHMVVATNPKKATWAIHDVVANVQEIQIRVCTVKSGSRGDACVTLHQSYAVMEPSKLMPPWEDKANAIVERFHAAAVLVDASTGGDGPQVRDVASPPPSSESKSILEHFAIQDDVHLLLKQRSPASSATAAVVVASTPSKEKFQTPRRLSASRLPPPPPSTASPPLGDGHDSSPELGCLCYVLVHQPRVHMTLDTIDAVVEMALEWRALVQEYMPPSDIPISVIHQVEAAVATPVADTCDDASGDLTSHLEHMLHPAVQPKVRVSSTNDFLLHSQICDDVDDERLPITTDMIAIQTLLRINVVDFQLAVQDSAHKGSILVAIPSGCVEPAVDLEHHTEHVDVSVCGVFVFTSSLEVDMTSNMHHTWLKVERSVISQSSTMLWKQVLHASAIECGISHDVVPNVHQVTIHVANIDAILDAESKQTLLDMGTLLSARIQDKLESHTKAAANSVVIESGASTPPSTHPPLNTEGDDGPLSSTPDVVAMLPQLWRQRRTLQWTIATLRYVESCRFGVLASAVPDVDAAALRSLPRRRLSSVQSPPSRPSAASARLTALAHDFRVLNAEVAFAIREYYKYKQVHPTVDLHFELDEAALLVKGPTFDLLRLQLQQVEGTVAHFQDQSGTLSIQLHTMSAANLMPQTPLPDLVVPVDRNQQAKADFVDAGGVVRVDAEMAAPVGGQLVVQHFEINVLPLQVCITYELVLQLVAFMSTAQSPHIHKQEEMVRSQFLVYKTSSKKAPRVSNTSDDMANLLRGDDGDPPRPPPPTTTTTTSNNRSSYNLVTFKHIRLGTILVLLTYKSITLPRSYYKATGGKATPAMPQHLEEMRGFELKLHSLVYTDKTCTLSELVLRVRRDILLDVLSQVGRNFNNIGIFLKERLDISRWAGFDMNNPLKSLSMSSGAADVPPSAVPKKPSQVVFSLELKPDKSAKLNPIKKAKSRFGFLKQKDKQSH